jgi:hypothetical protein
MTTWSTQPLTEMSTRNISWQVKRIPLRRTDAITTFLCRLSWKLGASTSWNPQGLSRHVMGLVYLLLCSYTIYRYIRAYNVFQSANIMYSKVQI